MLEIYINDQQKTLSISPAEIEKMVRDIYRLAGLQEKGELSITFMDNDGIRELNRQYLQKDRPTDVLAFSQSEGAPVPIPENEDFMPLIGDIIISTETAKSQAEEMGHSVKKEIALLLIHGILHLYGYDHDYPNDEGLMRKEEERILGNLIL